MMQRCLITRRERSKVSRCGQPPNIASDYSQNLNARISKRNDSIQFLSFHSMIPSTFIILFHHLQHPTASVTSPTAPATSPASTAACAFNQKPVFLYQLPNTSKSFHHIGATYLHLQPPPPTKCLPPFAPP